MYDKGLTDDTYHTCRFILADIPKSDDTEVQ